MVRGVCWRAISEEVFIKKPYKTLFLVLSLSLSVFSEIELNGTPHELANYLSEIPETVSITGTAEKKLPADRAVIHLKISTENRSMNEALTANQDLREKISAGLTAAGFSPERIQAAQFSSTPESGFFTDKVRRYRVENTMKVTALNEAEFRAVAALIDENHEIRYEKTDFELSGKKEMERLVLAEACRDAAAKKALYQTELLITLTPMRFHDGRVLLSQPTYGFAGKAMLREISQTEGADGDFAAPSPPQQFDEIKFTATVTVEYRLSPK